MVLSKIDLGRGHFILTSLIFIIIFLSEARLLSVIPEKRGPILDSVIKKKLYKCATEIMIPANDILRYNLREIGHQLLIRRKRTEIEVDEIYSNDGPFTNIPREIIFKIFSHLNMYSLGID